MGVVGGFGVKCPRGYIHVDFSEKIRVLLLNGNLVQATDSTSTVHAADAVEEELQQNGYRPQS
jgi:hypothetical protein